MNVWVKKHTTFDLLHRSCDVCWFNGRGLNATKSPPI